MLEVQQIPSRSNVIGEGFGQRPNGQTQKKVSERENTKKLQEVVAELNRVMGFSNTKIAFTVDRASKKTVIKVINTNSGEVIRQIPLEEAVKLTQHVESLTGIIYDGSA